MLIYRLILSQPACNMNWITSQTRW